MMAPVEMNGRDPREYLARYWPNVPILTLGLPGDIRGRTIWRTAQQPEIQLSERLGPNNRLDVLAHEMLHVERGEPDPWNQLAEERIVIEMSARWRLPDMSLVREVTRDHGLGEAAGLLGVAGRTLLTRLRGMTRAEASDFYQ